MAWTDKAAILLRRRAAAVARPVPAALRPVSLPAVDADVPVPIPAHEIDCIGLPVEIGYRDGRGVPSERRVTIRRAWCTAGDATLDCWCHERSGPRRFLASRIFHVIDPTTAAPIASVGDFLERYLFVSGGLPATVPLAQRLPALRPILYMLACLGRPGADGDRALILARGSSLFADPAAAGPGLAGLLGHMAYDAELVDRASAALSGYDEDRTAWIARTVGDLVALAAGEDGVAPWLAAWHGATA